MQRSITFALLVLLCWMALRLASARENHPVEVPLYVVTHVDVLPNFTNEGRDLLKRFVKDSRKEAGAVRIEVFEELSRPNHSTVVEVWESRKSYDDHLAAEATRTFRAKLQPFLGSPFDERLHRLSE